MKKKVVGLLLILLSACKLYGQDSPEVKVVKKVYEAFNAHDWERMLSYYAVDVVLLDPSIAEGRQVGTAGMLEKYAALQRQFPDIRDELLNIYASGEQVIVEFVSIGTTPDGLEFRLPICSIFTIKDGKIVRDATYYDN